LLKWFSNYGFQLLYLLNILSSLTLIGGTYILCGANKIESKGAKLTLGIYKSDKNSS